MHKWNDSMSIYWHAREIALCSECIRCCNTVIIKKKWCSLYPLEVYSPEGKTDVNQSCKHISNLSCSKFSKRIHVLSDAHWIIRDSQEKLVVEYPPANAGDAGLIPKSGRSLGEGNDNPLQYSCLENPMDSKAWWTIVHRVSKTLTWLKRLSTSKSC